MPIFPRVLEHVNIRGQPWELGAAAVSIDRHVQQIIEKTETIKHSLARYAGGNEGNYYALLCGAVQEMTRALAQAGWELNEAQRQVVEYAKRICRFNHQDPDLVPNPNQFNVDIVDIDVNRTGFQMHLHEMQELRRDLMNYRNSVYDETQLLLRDTNNLGDIWTDNQYMLYQEYISNVCNNIINGGLNLLEVYINVLTHDIIDAGGEIEI